MIRSLFPAIDLFDDLAAPEDWPLLIAAEQKTNPRLMASLGALDLVPKERRASGPGSSFLMAPFAHFSPDRPSRFSDGTYGVLYAAKRFETALMETVYHFARFMAQTKESPGWTSQFRELKLSLNVSLHDLRGGAAGLQPALDKDSYVESQQLGKTARASSSEGMVYPSQRDPAGQCVALFFPDRPTNVTQSRHVDYHWNGTRVDLYRDTGSGQIFRIE